MFFLSRKNLYVLEIWQSSSMIMQSCEIYLLLLSRLVKEGDISDAGAAERLQLIESVCLSLQSCDGIYSWLLEQISKSILHSSKIFQPFTSQIFKILNILFSLHLGISQNQVLRQFRDQRSVYKLQAMLLYCKDVF